MKPLGQYTNLRQIGSGGMGKVYAAEDPTLNRQVALRVPSGQPVWAPALGRALQVSVSADRPAVIDFIAGKVSLFRRFTLLLRQPRYSMVVTLFSISPSLYCRAATNWVRIVELGRPPRQLFRP